MTKYLPNPLLLATPVYAVLLFLRARSFGLRTNVELWGPLIGLSAGTAICMLGVIDYRHVEEAWEHTTFHPGYEINGAAFLVYLGLFTMVVSGIVGLVGGLRRWAKR